MRKKLAALSPAVRTTAPTDSLERFKNILSNLRVMEAVERYAATTDAPAKERKRGFTSRMSIVLKRP